MGLRPCTLALPGFVFHSPGATTKADFGRHCAGSNAASCTSICKSVCTSSFTSICKASFSASFQSSQMLVCGVTFTRQLCAGLKLLAPRVTSPSLAPGWPRGGSTSRSKRISRSSTYSCSRLAFVGTSATSAQQYARL